MDGNFHFLGLFNSKPAILREDAMATLRSSMAGEQILGGTPWNSQEFETHRSYCWLGVCLAIYWYEIILFYYRYIHFYIYIYIHIISIPYIHIPSHPRETLALPPSDDDNEVEPQRLRLKAVDSIQQAGAGTCVNHGSVLESFEMVVYDIIWYIYIYTHIYWIQRYIYIYNIIIYSIIYVVLHTYKIIYIYIYTYNGTILLIITLVQIKYQRVVTHLPGEGC